MREISDFAIAAAALVAVLAVLCLPYYFESDEPKQGTGVVGSADMMGSMIATLGDKYAAMAEARTLSLQNVGGSTIPYQIKIYPKSFEHKSAINE